MLTKAVVIVVAGSLVAIVSPRAEAIAGQVNGFSEPAQVLDIGSRVELFVDDWLIDRMDAVRLDLKTPVDAGKVMDFDKPWEGTESNYMHIFRDGDKWRMYYRAAQWGGPKSKRFTHICYAESADGINWMKPILGLHAFAGNKDNNITYKGPGAAAWYCFKDENPDTSDEARYKSILNHVIGARSAKGIGAMASPDGLQWKWWDGLEDAPRTGIWDGYMQYGTPKNAIITGGPLDSLNTVRWDERQKLYLAYVRNWAHVDEGYEVPPDVDTPSTEYHTWAEPGKGRVRSIAVSTSKDFQTWTRPQWLVFDEGTPLEHLYTNAVTPYFRAPHIYLAFPMRFLPEREVITGWAGSERGTKGASDTVFMSSRDGVHWDRRFLQSFLRPGLDQKNWTDRNMIVSPGVVHTGAGEISIYYITYYKRRDIHVQRRRLRLDGFASVNASYAGGEFVTKPIVFSGVELVINYSTSAAGDLRVEIQDAGGTAIEGYTLDDAPQIIGDQIERVVSWQHGSDVSSLAGQPVRLRFVMKDADLYSIRFRTP